MKCEKMQEYLRKNLSLQMAVLRGVTHSNVEPKVTAVDSAYQQMVLVLTNFWCVCVCVCVCVCNDATFLAFSVPSESKVAQDSARQHGESANVGCAHCCR